MAERLTPAQRELLERERLQLGQLQSLRVQIPHLVTDCALTWMALEAGVGWVAWVFLVASTVLQLGRTQFMAWQRRKGNASLQAQVRFMRLSPLAFGTVQALLVGAVFLQEPSSWQYLVTMILFGIAAGSVSAAAGDAWSYARWACLVGGSLALSWFLLLGGLTGAVAGSLILVLMLVLVGYVRDQGHAQERLIRLNDELRQARDLAQAANEARTRFFAAASHDLRQPLTALSYNVATVEALAELQGNAELARVGSGLRRSLAESQGLLASLLELSQLDAGAVEVQRTTLDLAVLVAETVESFAPQAEQRGLLLLADVQPGAGGWRTESDLSLLRRVLHNLVGNALKFTQSGEVRVSLRRQADEIELSVSDTGPGIAPELQERVFEEFFQVGNPARNRSQGLGLGLSIVRRLVTLLALRLTLDSQPGQGCRFSLLLPRQDGRITPLAPPPPMAALASASDLKGPPLRVLAVDDESDIRDALAQLLGTLGWEMRSAYNVTEALAHLADGWQPDALVLDFRLRQGISGLDALAALRARGVDAPAWLVTGDTAPQRIQQAREAGIPVLYKPVDGLALVAQIRAAVRLPSRPTA